jgi:radical SAM family uncharacterized protein
VIALASLDSILYQVNKPARYSGGEWNSVVKDWDQTPVRVALAYPDVYEIGMSNMAIPILYDIFNRQPDILAERVYAPWVDMAAAMRQAGIPLFSLESKRPIKAFDVLGFSLGYELTYTNVLNMLDLAGIPLFAGERDDSQPLVIAGGSASLNPEPIADFFDLFVVGDGEEVALELLDHLREWSARRQKDDHVSVRRDMLRSLAKVPGVYVPSLYEVEYDALGLIKSFRPNCSEAASRIQRRIVLKLPPPVTNPVVPFIETVHDRGAIEIQRGCSNGCRFCQAGMIYRPIRERSHAEVIEATGEILSNCGYDEISLVSLSSSDYSGIDKLVAGLTQRYPDIGISLPSLYVGSFSVQLMEALPAHKKSGLTFAPEAGSERLRRAINKRITEQDLLSTASLAFSKGWTGLKLYFMLGLPGETDGDVVEIANLVNKVYLEGTRTGGRTPQVRVNLSTFIPKPHTPFQWLPREKEDALIRRQDILKQAVKRKAIKLSWSDPKVSLLEAALSRGDRRLGQVIHQAWRLGCLFDSWGEHFRYATWERAFLDCGINPDFYSMRERAHDELLPWSHIDVGVSTSFLKEECRRSFSGEETVDCRDEACNVCGLQALDPSCKAKAARP